MGAYISNQVKMHAYHLNFETLDNEFCKFHKRKLWRNPSSGKPTWNGQRSKLLLKNFHFWEIFNLGRPPMRITPPEKSLCFSTSFKCAFEPSIIFFKASLSPWPFKVVCFLTLSLFFREHLQALIFFLSAPLSPRFFSSAPSSPRPFFGVRLRALTSFECAFKPSTILSSAPSSLYFPFSFYWAGNLLQCDHPEKSLNFSIGQVTHYNVTILKNPCIFPLGR